MSDLWTLGVPVAEKVVRTAVVYGGLAVLLRVAGKRNLAQLNSFDLVVVLLLSNVVQNAIIGPDDSLTGALLAAVVLLGVNSLVVRVVNRSDLAWTPSSVHSAACQPDRADFRDQWRLSGRPPRRCRRRRCPVADRAGSSPCPAGPRMPPRNLPAAHRRRPSDGQRPAARRRQQRRTRG